VQPGAWPGDGHKDGPETARLARGRGAEREEAESRFERKEEKAINENLQLAGNGTYYSDIKMSGEHTSASGLTKGFSIVISPCHPHRRLFPLLVRSLPHLVSF
jgi:hypothetical protein